MESTRDLTTAARFPWKVLSHCSMCPETVSLRNIWMNIVEKLD